MANKNHFGMLRDRFHFQKRSDANDGFRTVKGAGPFSTQFTESIGLEARRGGETVIASKLQGVQPYSALVRWSPKMLAVTNGWQLLDARVGGTRVLNIVSAPADPDGKRQWLEFMVTEGKAS